MKMERQVAFDKIVSIADYVVKRGAAKTDHHDLLGPETVYPNWVDMSALSSLDRESLAEGAGLNNLYIGLDRPEDSGTCIYRLVVTGSDRRTLQTRQLFVCGE
ncbi:TPA: hypothetical protein EYP38_02015 [Candidatus Micrarchaeota archaeon]|nr:hypothetical protein [Candidatus Micrarchaeota archaeon]